MPDEGRALLTEREREILSEEADVTDNYRYKVQSTVRNRVRKRLGRDIEFLEEHFPEVYELVLEEACDDHDDVDAGALRETIVDAREAYEDVDGDGVREALSRAEALLGMGDDENVQ